MHLGRTKRPRNAPCGGKCPVNLEFLEGGYIVPLATPIEAVVDLTFSSASQLAQCLLCSSVVFHIYIAYMTKSLQSSFTDCGLQHNVLFSLLLHFSLCLSHLRLVLGLTKITVSAEVSWSLLWVFIDAAGLETVLFSFVDSIRGTSLTNRHQAVVSCHAI